MTARRWAPHSEVERCSASGPVERVEQRHGVALRVHHGQRLARRAHLAGHALPGDRGVGAPLVAHAPQRLEEPGWVGDDLGGRHGGERVNGLEGGLGGRAEHHAHPVVLHEIAQHVEDGRQEVGRQCLRLVEDHHAAGQAVELAAPRGLVREEALEELHGGGHDDRCVPVLRGQASPRRRRIEGLVVPAPAGLAVVLQDHATGIGGHLQRLAVGVGRLLGDGQEGHRHDDPPLAVVERVPQREREAGERLAAAGRDRQAKDAGRGVGRGQARRVHLGAHARHHVARRRRREAGVVALEPAPQLAQVERRDALLGSARVEVPLRVQEVGIDQRGIEQPDEEFCADGIGPGMRGSGGGVAGASSGIRATAARCACEHRRPRQCLRQPGPHLRRRLQAAMVTLHRHRREAKGAKGEVRAGGLVIRPVATPAGLPLAAREVRLKLGVPLADVVGETHKPRRVRRGQRLAEAARKLGHAAEVRHEVLPCTIGVPSMGDWLHGSSLPPARKRMQLRWSHHALSRRSRNCCLAS